jgi:glyoxylase-like metal-dependent hydrolase (beta-lactamase superfamily II)
VDTGDPSVHRLEIPPPYAIGTVNAFLIEDDPLTLIDCGPASTTALDALEDALAVRGYALQDVRLLLVTHQHTDHLGLAASLARRAGTEIACLAGLAEISVDFAYAEEEHQAAAAVMRRHGVPDDVVDTLEASTRPIRHWGPPFRADRQLLEGEAIELRDRRLQVVHAPGHSPTDTLFVDPERRALFAGDHLLAHTSANGLVVSRPPGSPVRERYPALIDYAASLRATRAIDVDVVHTGHGEPVTDHRALVDKRLAQHESRCERLLDLVRERPRSVHDLAFEIWGRRARQQCLLTTSEVLGHLDMLVERGAVREADDEDVVLWESA